jgi:molybdopterin synthase catalytic subunit
MRIRRERMRRVAIVRTVMWTEGEIEVGELFFVILIASPRFSFFFLACRDAVRNLGMHFNQP